MRGLGISQSSIARYLPDNYEVVGSGEDRTGPYVVIAGEDRYGWTLDGYVIPRLQTGLYSCDEITKRRK